MSYKIEISAEASFDLQEIVAWYRLQRPGLDLDFITCFQVTIEQIERAPKIFQTRKFAAQIALLPRFLYKVLFKTYAETIKVYSVLHHSRNPKLIRKRLR